MSALLKIATLVILLIEAQSKPVPYESHPNAIDLNVESFASDLEYDVDTRVYLYNESPLNGNFSERSLADSVEYAVDSMKASKGFLESENAKNYWWIWFISITIVLGFVSVFVCLGYTAAVVIHSCIKCVH